MFGHGGRGVVGVAAVVRVVVVGFRVDAGGRGLRVQ